MGKDRTGVNPQIKLNVIRDADFRCTYCGTFGSNKNYLTIDHVFPKTLGGDNRQSNLTCCCLDCNRTKGSQLLTTFIKQRKIRVTKEIARFL